MSRPRILLVLVLLAACRRDASPLDDVQKIAYSAKPAVVRVSAFATADFRYPASAIESIESQLRARGNDIRVRGIDPAETAQPAVDTGAGGSGSGFIIHPDGYILTSGHVVAPTRDPEALQSELLRNGAVAALVRHFPVDALRTIHREDALDRYVGPLAAAGRVENVRVVNQVELSNGEALPYRIRRYSPALHQRGTDLAILQIDRKGLPSLPLGDSDSTRVGESIWSIGYPAVASSTDEVIGGWLSRESDLEATFNPGIITAIKRNIANTPVFQSNVAIYRGNSGGPAVNARGEVVAVSTWGHTSAEQIKFLVPINVARELLAAANIPASSGGEFNVHYRAALDAAAGGEWIEAKTQLAVATRLFQKSPDLIRFARDAERAVDAMPPWRVRPLTTALAGTAGIGMIGAAALVAARRRRTPLAPAIEVPVTLDAVVTPAGVAAASDSLLGKLTILNGTRAGAKLGLGGSGIRIGRESAICEIVLENPKVSRLHAELVCIDGRILLIDRNSSNGTYVNDEKIDKRVLQDGDIIHFGGRNAVGVAFHA